jgi:ligand-binding sensor domain-containing protein
LKHLPSDITQRPLNSPGKRNRHLLWCMDRQILFILLLISPSLFGQNPTSRNHSLPPPHSKDPIDQILQAKNGILYVSSLERLYAYDSHAFELINASSEQSPQITCLYEGPDFNIWIGREDGTVVYYNPTLDSLIAMPVFQPANQSSISGILKNDTGLWIATRGNGIFLLRNKTTFHLDQQYLESNTDIYTMTSSADDQVWIGHDGGMQAVDFMPDKKSGTFQLSSPVFPGQIVTAIASGSDSILWLGLFDNGIGRYNINSKESIIPLSNWQAGPVRTLVTWGEHEVWIGSTYEGLWRYDIHRNTLRVHDCESGRKEKKINDLLTDLEGNIWVTSAKEGLISIYRPIEWVGGMSKETQAVLEDNSGTVWAGTTNGLFRMQQDESCGMTWSSEPVCLAGVPIISLEETADSLIWIGTFGDGLFTYNRFTNILSEPLKNESRLNGNILSIRSDGAESLVDHLGGYCQIKMAVKS